jgi:hypothetical protein
MSAWSNSRGGGGQSLGWYFWLPIIMPWIAIGCMWLIIAVSP